LRKDQIKLTLDLLDFFIENFVIYYVYV